MMITKLVQETIKANKFLNSSFGSNSK